MWTRIGKVALGVMFGLLTALGIGTPAVAGSDVSVEAYVEKTTACVGRSLGFTIEIRGRFRDYTQPDIKSIPGAKIYGRGTSHRINVINGRLSSSVAYEYVLVPLKQGKLVIPSVSVKVDGKTYTTRQIEVDVVNCGGSSHTPNKGAYSYPVPSSVPDSARSSEETFAVINLDKKKVYLGEPIVLTYTVYTRSRVKFKGFAVRPLFEGFVTEEVPPAEDLNREEVRIGGVRYVRADILRFVLVPTKTGKLTIDPGTLSMAKLGRLNSLFRDMFSDSLWDDLFDEDFFATEEPFVLRPAEKEVEVLPLPEEGRPGDFSGLVGDFSIKAELSKDEVKVGDSVELKITVKGTGPLSALKQFDLELDGARVYPSSSRNSFDMVGGRPIYTRVFEYIVIPNRPGKIEIPPIKINYFSPSQKNYLEAQTKPLYLNVRPNPAVTTSKLLKPTASSVSTTGEEVQQLGEDIRFIKTSVSRRSGDVWWLVVVVNLLGVFWLVYRLFGSRIAGFGSRVSSRVRVRSELERLVARLERGEDEEGWRQLLSSILRLASEKYGRSIGTFGELAHLKAEVKEVAGDLDGFLFGRIPMSEPARKKALDKIKALIRTLSLVIGLFLLAGGHYLWANEAKGSWEVNFVTGNSAYESGDYESAKEEYLQALKLADPVRFELYYNLGNAYFKLGQYPLALLYYLKAYKANPLDADVRFNLRVVRERLGLTGDSALVSWLAPLRLDLLALVFSLSFWLLVWVSLSRLSPAKRLTLGLLLASFAIVSLGLALLVKGYRSQDYALAIEKAGLYAGPSQGESQIAVVRPGVELRVLADQGEWVEVRTNSGVVGWVEKDKIRRI